MVGSGSQDVDDLLNRNRFEPRKLGIGKRQLFIINQHPDAMAGYIRDLSPKVVAPGIDDLLLV
jgi:hypothetical protein